MGHRIALLVSGASGMLLPRHALGRLAAHPAIERIHLVVSAGASQVLRHELGSEKTGGADLIEAAELPPEERAKVVLHRDNELDAPIASGSYRLTGTARTLIHRAGAVGHRRREGLPAAPLRRAGFLSAA